MVTTQERAALARLSDWGLGFHTRAAYVQILAGNGRTAAMGARYLARVLVTQEHNHDAMLKTIDRMPRTLIAALFRLTKSDDLTR